MFYSTILEAQCLCTVIRSRKEGRHCSTELLEARFHRERVCQTKKSRYQNTDVLPMAHAKVFFGGTLTVKNPVLSGTKVVNQTSRVRGPYSILYKISHGASKVSAFSKEGHADSVLAQASNGQDGITERKISRLGASEQLEDCPIQKGTG